MLYLGHLFDLFHNTDLWHFHYPFHPLDCGNAHSPDELTGLALGHRHHLGDALDLWDLHNPLHNLHLWLFDVLQDLLHLNLRDFHNSLHHRDRLWVFHYLVCDLEELLGNSANNFLHHRLWHMLHDLLLVHHWHGDIPRDPLDFWHLDILWYELNLFLSYEVHNLLDLHLRNLHNLGHLLHLRLLHDLLYHRDSGDVHYVRILQPRVAGWCC